MMGAALPSITATIAPAVLAIVGGIFIILGLRWRDKEDWSADLNQRFGGRVTQLYPTLDEAYRKWRSSVDDDVPGRWTHLCGDAEWAFSYKDVQTTGGKHLLSFAKAIYPPDAKDDLDLADRSIIETDDFGDFHYTHRKEAAHYLVEACAEAERSVLMARWLKKKLGGNPKFPKMIVYLSMPLRVFTDQDDNLEVVTALSWLRVLG